MSPWGYGATWYHPPRILKEENQVEAWASQERPMLGGREQRAFADRPKAEHIVLLRRR